MPQIQCVNCGKEINRCSWRIRCERQFCGRECFRAFQKSLIKTVTCLACGLEFNRPQSQFHGSETFCSWACKYNPTARFWRNIQKTDNCWLWTGHVTQDGYGRLAVDGKRILAHRFSFWIHYSKPPDGILVCHTCDMPPCCNPLHLFLGSDDDNVQDAARKGRLHAKLTAEIVRDMRKRRAAGEWYKTIAADYGVTTATAFQAIRGRNWKYVV